VLSAQVSGLASPFASFSARHLLTHSSTALRLSCQLARPGWSGNFATMSSVNDRRIGEGTPPGITPAWSMVPGIPKPRASFRMSAPIPSWFENWLEAEREAHTLRLWSPILVPGLLQTAEYARALLAAAGEDAERADELVTARLERQAILDRSRPPHVVAVLDEAVLHRLIGTPAIRHDQLTRLAALSERPHVSVEIVPASTAANAGLSGGFQLASCDGAPDVLNMSGVEDVTAESRSLLRRATVVFDLVRGDALPPTASRTVITEAAELWKQQ